MTDHLHDQVTALFRVEDAQRTLPKQRADRGGEAVTPRPALLLVAVGLSLVIASLALWGGQRIGLGHLPGDLSFGRGRLRLRLRLTLAISVVATVVLNLVLRR